MYSTFSLIGTLISTPTKLTTQSGLTIATLSIQLKDKGGSVIEVKAYKDEAVKALTLTPGSIVIANGAIRSREWTNKAGKTSHIIELMAFKVQALEDKNNSGGADIPF